MLVNRRMKQVQFNNGFDKYLTDKKSVKTPKR
jgi:hypothetical protein